MISLAVLPVAAWVEGLKCSPSGGIRDASPYSLALVAL